MDAKEAKDKVNEKIKEDNLRNDDITKTIVESTSVSGGTFTGNLLMSFDGKRAMRMSLSFKTDTSGDLIYMTAFSYTGLLTGDKIELEYDGTEYSYGQLLGGLSGFLEIFYDVEKLFDFQVW